jgi:hypothetical protein
MFWKTRGPTIMDQLLRFYTKFIDSMTVCQKTRQESRDGSLGSFLEALRSKTIHYKEHAFSTCLTCSLVPTDALWLDGPAAYGLRYRELVRWAPYVKKFIFLPGTTKWKTQSEFIQQRIDPFQKGLEYYVPAEDLFDGLERAIQHFLKAHTDWAISYDLNDHSYGLTVLIRRDRGDYVGPL